MPSYSRRHSFAHDDYPLPERRPSATGGLADDYYDHHSLDGHHPHEHDRNHHQGPRGYYRSYYDDIPRVRFPRARSRNMRAFDLPEADVGLNQTLKVTKRERSPSAGPQHDHRRRIRRSSSVTPDSSIDDFPQWHRERERGRSRTRARSYDRSHDHEIDHGRISRRHSQQPRGSRSADRWGKQAARAALLAGAVEAWRVRNEVGPWIGQKSNRIATAVLGSAAIDATLASKEPDRHAGRHAFASTVGGMVVNRLANGRR